MQRTRGLRWILAPALILAPLLIVGAGACRDVLGLDALPSLRGSGGNASSTASGSASATGSGGDAVDASDGASPFVQLTDSADGPSLNAVWGQGSFVIAVGDSTISYV